MSIRWSIETRLKRIALICLLSLAALVAVANVRYSGKASAAAGCDADLWSHVYRPKRLRVLTPCAAVEGRVTGVHANEDGDLHIALDPDEPSVLNLANLLHGGGTLVVEAICDHPSPQPEV